MTLFLRSRYALGEMQQKLANMLVDIRCFFVFHPPEGEQFIWFLLTHCIGSFYPNTYPSSRKFS